MVSNTPAGQALRRHLRDTERLDKSGNRGVTSKSLERKIKAAEKAGNVKQWQALRAKMKYRDNPKAAVIRAKAAASKARKKGIKQGHIVQKPGVRQGLTASYTPMYSAYLDFLTERVGVGRAFKGAYQQRKAKTLARGRKAGWATTKAVGALGKAGVAGAGIGAWEGGKAFVRSIKKSYGDKDPTPKRGVYGDDEPDKPELPTPPEDKGGDDLPDTPEKPDVPEKPDDDEKPPIDPSKHKERMDNFEDREKERDKEREAMLKRLKKGQQDIDDTDEWMRKRGIGKNKDGVKPPADLKKHRDEMDKRAMRKAGQDILKKARGPQKKLPSGQKALPATRAQKAISAPKAQKALPAPPTQKAISAPKAQKALPAPLTQTKLKMKGVSAKTPTGSKLGPKFYATSKARKSQAKRAQATKDTLKGKAGRGLKTGRFVVNPKNLKQRTFTHMGEDKGDQEKTDILGLPLVRKGKKTLWDKEIAKLAAKYKKQRKLKFPAKQKKLPFKGPYKNEESVNEFIGGLALAGRAAAGAARAVGKTLSTPAKIVSKVGKRTALGVRKLVGRKEGNGNNAQKKTNESSTYNRMLDIVAEMAKRSWGQDAKNRFDKCIKDIKNEN